MILYAKYQVLVLASKPSTAQLRARAFRALAYWCKSLKGSPNIRFTPSAGIGRRPTKSRLEPCFSGNV